MLIRRIISDSLRILFHRCQQSRFLPSGQSQYTSRQTISMNRPRNRQPKPQRGGGDNRGARGGRGGFSRPDYHPVPSIQQVIPGASVSIVLKQDQPTGREVQGTVQELLTRGNHPRGIKVRLTDGRVGRVQRMAGDGTGPPTSTRAYDRSDMNQAQDGPPPRTLADFLPITDEEPSSMPPAIGPTFATATAKCPICGLFEGDEIAVSRHVEEHLT